MGYFNPRNQRSDIAVRSAATTPSNTGSEASPPFWKNRGHLTSASPTPIAAYPARMMFTRYVGNASEAVSGRSAVADRLLMLTPKGEGGSGRGRCGGARGRGVRLASG